MWGQFAGLGLVDGLHKLACEVVARHSANGLYGGVRGARAARKWTLYTFTLDSRSVHHDLLGRPSRLNLNLAVGFLRSVLGDINVDVWLRWLNELLFLDRLFNKLACVVLSGRS